MGLFGGGNTQASTTNVYDTSSGANVGGDTTSPVLSLASADGNTFQFVDGGALATAKDIADGSFNFAAQALQKSAGAYNDTASALQNAYQQSLSFVGKQTQPADENVRQQFTWLAFGVLAVAAIAFYRRAH